MWHAVPMTIVISLVYAATRHEEMGPILRHAARFAVWVGVFMLGLFGLLWWLTDSL